MKWFLRVLMILGVLILLMFIMGSTLPQKHTASSTQTFSATREEVWMVLTRFEEWPSWRTDVKNIQTGHNSFTEVNGDGESVEYQIDEFAPPERLVTRIVTPDLPYSGSWTYELTTADNGCTLSITENGEVYNPLFRFMSKYMFGHATTMENYLSDLKKRIQ